MFLVAVVCFACIAANAQHPHWGLKGGLNLANLDIHPGDNMDYKVGIHIGGLAHIHLSDHFALQPELMYSNQGGQKGVGATEYKSKASLCECSGIATVYDRLRIPVANWSTDWSVSECKVKSK